MEIPVLRFFPDGSVVVQTFTRRSPEIERLAHVFLRSGGRYLTCVHPDGGVEMVAAIPANTVEGYARVAEAWCEDDPALPQAFDQLVRDSVDRVHAAPTVIH